MKIALISFMVLALIGLGGYFGYQYLISVSPSTSGVNETPTVTKTGTVQSLSKPGSDYTHILKTPEESVKLNSYTVKLDQYVNTTVTVVGQYSGYTLFVDSIK